MQSETKRPTPAAVCSPITIGGRDRGRSETKRPTPALNFRSQTTADVQVYRVQRNQRQR